MKHNSNTKQSNKHVTTRVMHFVTACAISTTLHRVPTQVWEVWKCKEFDLGHFQVSSMEEFFF